MKFIEGEGESSILELPGDVRWGVDQFQYIFLGGLSYRTFKGLAWSTVSINNEWLLFLIFCGNFTFSESERNHKHSSKKQYFNMSKDLWIFKEDQHLRSHHCYLDNKYYQTAREESEEEVI